MPLANKGIAIKDPTMNLAGTSYRFVAPLSNQTVNALHVPNRNNKSAQSFSLVVSCLNPAFSLLNNHVISAIKDDISMGPAATDPLNVRYVAKYQAAEKPRVMDIVLDRVLLAVMDRSPPQKKRVNYREVYKRLV